MERKGKRGAAPGSVPGTGVKVQPVRCRRKEELHADLTLHSAGRETGRAGFRSRCKARQERSFGQFGRSVEQERNENSGSAARVSLAGDKEKAPPLQALQADKKEKTVAPYKSDP